MRVDDVTGIVGVSLSCGVRSRASALEATTAGEWLGVRALPPGSVPRRARARSTRQLHWKVDAPAVGPGRNGSKCSSTHFQSSSLDVTAARLMF